MNRRENRSFRARGARTGRWECRRARTGEQNRKWSTPESGHGARLHTALHSVLLCFNPTLAQLHAALVYHDRQPSVPAGWSGASLLIFVRAIGSTVRDGEVGPALSALPFALFPHSSFSFSFSCSASAQASSSASAKSSALQYRRGAEGKKLGEKRTRGSRRSTKRHAPTSTC